MREATRVDDFYIEVLQDTSNVVLRTTNRKGVRVPDDFELNPDLAEMLAAALLQAAADVRAYSPRET